MTIAENLLPKLNDWETTGSGRHSLTLPVEGTSWALDVTADRVDSLGCLAWEMTLRNVRHPVLSNAELKTFAARAAERVTGLMEPLRFIELDELRGEALLRSESPTQRSTALAYYEVLMTGSRIALRRFQKAPDKQTREQIAFPLTHESIAKFVDDFVRE